MSAKVSGEVWDMVLQVQPQALTSANTSAVGPHCYEVGVQHALRGRNGSKVDDVCRYPQLPAGLNCVEEFGLPRATASATPLHILFCTCQDADGWLQQQGHTKQLHMDCRT